MIVLVDTQLILWGLREPGRLSKSARGLFNRENAENVFSAASIWEIAIKSLTRREGFDANPKDVRRTLLKNSWRELSISADHAASTIDLPPIHNDPFDRILIAQSMVEGMKLATADTVIAQYPGNILKV